MSEYTMDFVDQLNALAQRIPREVFFASGALNCVTYVLVHQRVGGGEVIYAGEGLPLRATMQFEKRGKNTPELDRYIAEHWPNFSVYIAASNITKSVAVSFEGVLIREYKPRFNIRGASSVYADVGVDTFDSMRGAELVDYKFAASPPRFDHVALWKECAIYAADGRKVGWDEIPLDWIITRNSLRPKRSRKPHEIIHLASYPGLGGKVTVGDHRGRNEAAGMSWDKDIKAILHWDRLYEDDPIINIGPR
jgi:hypothetical protein